MRLANLKERIGKGKHSLNINVVESENESDKVSTDDMVRS